MKKIMHILNLRNKKLLLNLQIMKSQRQRNSRVILVRKKICTITQMKITTFVHLVKNASKRNKKKKTKSGYETTVSIYEYEDCDGCEYKSKCTKAKGNKQIHVAKNFMRLRTNSLKNITTPKGILLRMNRSIQVEGAFGVIKQDYGFRRFLCVEILKFVLNFC